jgi:hypothetical protein
VCGHRNDWCNKLLQLGTRDAFLFTQEKPTGSELKGQRENPAFQSEMPRIFEEKGEKVFLQRKIR